MAIDTLANVKTQLGVTGTTDDALLTKLQAAADDFIARHCGRAFDGGSYTEDLDGGGRMLVLTNYPIQAVTSVSVDPARAFGPETVVPSDEYFIHPDDGTVETLGAPFGRVGEPGTVRVVYSTATGSVPQSVCRAYAELIGHWYRQVKTQVATGQLNVIQQTNGTTVTEYPWGQSGGFRLPNGVLALLAPFRVPNL
jgi:uncharacterized phiE125 gp8 family phage protein